MMSPPITPPMIAGFPDEELDELIEGIEDVEAGASC